MIRINIFSQPVDPLIKSRKRDIDCFTRCIVGSSSARRSTAHSGCKQFDRSLIQCHHATPKADE